MRQHNINYRHKRGWTGRLTVFLAALACCTWVDTAAGSGNTMQCVGPDRGDPYGGWGHHGVMDRPEGMSGMVGGSDIERYGALNLSVEQMSKIDAIRGNTRKKHWELMNKMMDDAVRLRELRNVEKPDPAAVGRQYAKIQDMQRQMLELSVDAENRIEALLTKEQKNQFRKLRRWMRTNSSDYRY